MIDHVALLVTSLDEAIERAVALGCGHPGEVRTFAAEGTREVYLGRLLLLEAVAEGPYRRALARRGPGLHHVALVGPLAAPPGWSPILETPGTLWLSHPGLPLIEVLAPPPAAAEPRPAIAVEWPCRTGALEALGCHQLRASADDQGWLLFGERAVGIAALVG